MWEMFLIIFVKENLAKYVSQVKKVQIAKGKFHMVGNKGALAYSFMLHDKVFNVIGVHLQHG